MEDTMIERASEFFALNKERLTKLSKDKDLYSAIAEMTGLSRIEVKNWMHGFAYGTDTKEG